MSLARSVQKRKGHCFGTVGQLKARKCYLYFRPLQVICFTWKLLLLNNDQEVSFPHWWIKSLFFPTIDAFCILYAVLCFLFVLEHTAWQSCHEMSSLPQRLCPFFKFSALVFLFIQLDILATVSGEMDCQFYFLRLVYNQSERKRVTFNFFSTLFLLSQGQSDSTFSQVKEQTVCPMISVRFLLCLNSSSG